MSLVELLAGVESHEATLTVYNEPDAVRAELAALFADRNVQVEHSGRRSDDEGFAVLSRDGEFVTAVATAELLADPDRTDPSFVRETYRPVLDHLDETTFTAFGKPRMIAASREIEDRAWRVGRGELHAGFQTLSILAEETEVYERLATAADLDVHAYAAPEGDRPILDGVTVHVERDPEIRDTWFVVYDGAGVDGNKCLLLAAEREPGRYYGFWSYDPGTVDYVLDHLRSRYGPATPDGSEDTLA